jgi:hypothetical protein
MTRNSTFQLCFAQNHTPAVIAVSTPKVEIEHVPSLVERGGSHWPVPYASLLLRVQLRIQLPHELREFAVALPAAEFLLGFEQPRSSPASDLVAAPPALH